MKVRRDKKWRIRDTEKTCVDGVALGAEDFVTDVILLLRETGIYQQRKDPKKVKQGFSASVRKVGAIA